MQDTSKTKSKHKSKSTPKDLLDEISLNDLWDIFVDMARQKDKDALKYIFNRTLPGVRSGINLPFELPMIETIHDVKEAENRINNSLNNKDITISEAKDLFQMLSETRQTIIARDLIIRVDNMDDSIPE